jgi:hypothetical protein
VREFEREPRGPRMLFGDGLTRPDGVHLYFVPFMMGVVVLIDSDVLQGDSAACDRP